MKTLQDKEEKLKAILEQHILFERIHPFSDSNGRVGRMLIFYSVLEQNLIPFVITKGQKEAYIKALDTRNTESLYQTRQSIPRVWTHTHTRANDTQ